jgi:cytochrome b561
MERKAMPTPDGYTRLQIALHWIAAVLIVQQYLFKDAIAAAWDATTKGLETTFDPLVLAHVAGGALVMLFALWRLSIKARLVAPAMVGDSGVQRALAKTTHQGLYALMILMPISGSLAWFGGVDLAAQGHNILKIVLLALVALHVVGVLYHHLVLKDGLINRMLRAEG